MLNRFAAGIDYLAIGHVTRDLDPGTAGGSTWGGTSAYAALTAQRLGLRSAILTTFDSEAELGPLAGIPIAGIGSEYSTTFNNRATDRGREQKVTHRAPRIHPYMLPEIWRSSNLVHFGPVLDEIDLALFRLFPDAFVGVTPQGWLREVDAGGTVTRADWPEAVFVLDHADAAVLSEGDVAGDEDQIRSFAEACRILVVTAGAAGCRVFVDGFPTEVRAQPARETDSTGAGDIFAAAFFTRLYRKDDPVDAARFAGRLAGASVGRRALEAVPTDAEVYEAATGRETTDTPDFPR
jgi:sugar/nucleoside kinase (ribokinase family)